MAEITSNNYDERSFKGVWIPKEIWLDKDLTLLDKAIMIEIDSLDRNEETGCYAGNEHFAEMFGCTPRKVSDSVGKLIKSGYVRVLRYDGRRRFLRSNMKYAFNELNNGFESDTNEFSSQTNEMFQSDSQNFLHSNSYSKPIRKEISPARSSELSAWFDEFWAAYPQKGRMKKQDAIRAFNALKPDRALVDAIIEDVEYKKEYVWVGDSARFVPYAVTYIHAKRWEDERIAPEPERKPYYDPFDPNQEITPRAIFGEP